MMVNSPKLLEITDLHVEVQGQRVLKGVSLTIDEGEIHAVFGPNGSGKTTLLGTIMGLSKYQVTAGSITFKGRDITSLSVDERAKLGIGMSFQRPPTIHGVKLRSLLELWDGVDKDQIDSAARSLNVGAFLDREINSGLSGGELKRVELLQLMLQSPDLVFLDEPESGVDLENMALIGRSSAQILGRRKSCCKRRCGKKAGLIITHTGSIMDYINVDRGHVMMDGRIVCDGSARDMLDEIRLRGYSDCLSCMMEVR